MVPVGLIANSDNSPNCSEGGVPPGLALVRYADAHTKTAYAPPKGKLFVAQRAAWRVRLAPKDGRPPADKIPFVIKPANQANILIEESGGSTPEDDGSRWYSGSVSFGEGGIAIPGPVQDLCWTQLSFAFPLGGRDQQILVSGYEMTPPRW